MADLQNHCSSDEERAISDEANRGEKRNNLIFAIFGSVLMVLALVLPFAYPRKEIELGMSALQLILWAAFCAAWLYQGYLLERSGVGFNSQASSSKRGEEPVSRYLESCFYILVFGPLCFGYIYVTHENTGYFGFNYVLMFVLSGFSTLIFPLWGAVVYLVYQCGCWVLLAYILWDKWMPVVEVATMLSGYFFSSMMFYIFRRERGARNRAFALSIKLDAANEKLRAFSRKIEELAATQERNRIAREIHDTIGHSLTVVNMQLETAKALLQSDKEKAGEFLEKAQSVTKKGLEEVRASVASLRSSPLEGQTLTLALEGLLGSAFDDSIKTCFELSEGSQKMNPAAEAGLYRSTQESFTNIRKHAEANQVNVHLDLSSAGGVSLTIEDNGKGCSDTSGGFGIMGIRERVQLLGGTLELSSSPGNGFKVSISIPR